VRAAMAYRAAGGRLSRLTFTIVIDRLSGLLALLVLGIGMLPALPLRYRDAGPFVAARLRRHRCRNRNRYPDRERVAVLLARLPAPVGPKLAYVVRECWRRCAPMSIAGRR